MTAGPAASPARAAVLAAVAARVPRPGRPVLVAVDGVDGAGKTTFADELAAACRPTWPGPVARASVDGFHHPAAHRHARGRTAEAFWSRSFDHAAFRSALVDPWRAGPGAPYRVAVHDVTTDRALDVPADVVPPEGLLLVDGIFLQREELRDAWDLVVFLDVPFEVSVPRMAQRDGSDPDPRAPSQARYVDGQRIYLATCDPRSRADVVVDNSDLSRPRLT